MTIQSLSTGPRNTPVPEAAGSRRARRPSLITLGAIAGAAVAFSGTGRVSAQAVEASCFDPEHGPHGEHHLSEGQRLFERETFGGNGRTCLTCHSRETGTLSPEDVARRLAADPDDPLFLHDGSDDGQGNGVSRLLDRATILVEIQLPANVRLADDPSARSVILRRGIPSTLNTPALDPVLMLDGRQPTLEAQAAGAIIDHAQGSRQPSEEELEAIADFERTDAFFSSQALRDFARGGAEPGLPEGQTDSERRGQLFFEDLPRGVDPRHGLCAGCHSGPRLDQTNQFLPVDVPVGTRFQNVLVSEFNVAGNLVRDFIFAQPDGSSILVSSSDPGRSLITGVAADAGSFDQVSAFKIPSLRGVVKTAPYFHDNSARTLQEVVRHYTRFFDTVTDPDGPGPLAPIVHLSAEDEADIVAYVSLL
jgi:hypothetical protein